MTDDSHDPDMVTPDPVCPPPATDDQILAMLASQVPDNPGGCSATDVLVALGLYQRVQDALSRLESAGRLTQTSPGHYLPRTGGTHG